MTRNGTLRALGGMLLIAAVAVALMACGSDDKDDEGGATSGGSQASTARKKLNDCEYAKQLLDDLGRFTTSLSGTSTASIGSKDQAVQAFNTLDAELGALISQMKGYQLSGDVAKVNTAFISVFEDMKKQVPEVRKAAESGDTAKLDQFSTTFGRDLDTKLDKIQEDNKGAVDKLNKCT